MTSTLWEDLKDKHSRPCGGWSTYDQWMRDFINSPDDDASVSQKQGKPEVAVWLSKENGPCGDSSWRNRRDAGCNKKIEDKCNIAATEQDASQNTFRPEISISRTTVWEIVITGHTNWTKGYLRQSSRSPKLPGNCRWYLNMMVKKFDQNYDELGAYSDFKNASDHSSTDGQQSECHKRSFRKITWYQTPKATNLKSWKITKQMQEMCYRDTADAHVKQRQPWLRCGSLDIAAIIW